MSSPINKQSETKSQHTPTPWNCDKDERGRYWINSSLGKPASSFPVASIEQIGRWYDGLSHSEEMAMEKANAAFIVRAVNAHEELLAIAEAIFNSDRTNNNGAYAGEATLCPSFARRLEAAIANAKEGGKEC